MGRVETEPGTGAMPKRYDWDEWFRAAEFTLRRGEQYECSQEAICQQVRAAASDRGIGVTVQDRIDSIRVIPHKEKQSAKSK